MEELARSPEKIIAHAFPITMPSGSSEEAMQKALLAQAADGLATIPHSAYTIPHRDLVLAPYVHVMSL